MINAKKLDELSKEDLAELCKIYAKNWLAHDGAWFLSVEEKYGMDVAMDLDRESWRKFTVVEAARLISFLKLGKNSGIEGLRKALLFRLYSSLNEDSIIVENDTTLISHLMNIPSDSPGTGKHWIQSIHSPPGTSKRIPGTWGSGIDCILLLRNFFCRAYRP